MELVRGIYNLTPKHHGCVLTIGNFDGVHQGHAAVIARLVEVAKLHQVPATVMLFDPQPQEFFAGDNAPARLSLLRDKLTRLSQLGVERVLCVRFNQKFADYHPQQFVEQLLVNQLGVRHLVVGDDFCFGKARQGNYAMLQQAGEQHGFTVQDTASCLLAKARISSTLIRQALAQGDLAAAQQMLGYPYRISGRVAHGDKLGRTLNFPTANIPLKRKVVPVRGVYAVTVQLASGERKLGVANVGSRPTVRGNICRLEVHIFDFAGDIYGQQLQVQLVSWLRDEQRFESLDALKAQISADVAKAKACLSAPEYLV
ncbi:bifunctional riboflavin kinase/FAD synthetase [Ferrimonas lipolytica]|uniref:Riboflavin biosynthesis protein n=1 Tax=Ferrimonas lipolytica TaxID=2724191 RepID=A0A6H1U8X8_9GAMM|nr:bifunctional riboflavin kinase/FAD synthetase [Ferrimonas lipolytica]QIZ75497.1 bifunctional riboflavin kinase/FAD synthetase [Ferrimonas lipolytica]